MELRYDRISVKQCSGKTHNQFSLRNKEVACNYGRCDVGHPNVYISSLWVQTTGSNEDLCCMTRLFDAVCA